MAEIITLSRDEIVERLERGARERLGMSAAEMIAGYRAGTIEWCGLIDLLTLADILEDGDPLHPGSFPKVGRQRIAGYEVTVYNDDGSWFAEGVAIDYAAAGATYAEMRENFTKGLRATIAAAGGIHRLMRPTTTTPPMEA